MRVFASIVAVSLGLIMLPSPGRAAELEPIPQPLLAGAGADVQALIEVQRSLVDELLKASAADQELASAFGTLGRLYFAYQFVDAAEASFRNALKLSPADYRWLYYLGLVHLEKREFEAAAEGFGRIAGHRPHDIAALLRLGQAKLELGQLEEARAAYSRVLEQDDSSAAGLFGLGRTALAQDRLAEAMLLLEAALHYQPSAKRIHYLLARANRKLGNEEAAAEHAEKYGPGEVVFPEALLRDLSELAKSAEFHISTADRAAAAGQYGFAAAAYRRALELDSRDTKAHLGLGAVLEQQSDLDGALGHYTQAAREAPDNAMVRFALGRLHSRMGSVTEAIKELEEVLRLDSRHEQAQIQLAGLLAAAGEHERALDLFDQVLEWNPQQRIALLQRPNVLRRMGRALEARESLERAVELMPDDAGARLNLATALMKTGPVERAVTELRWVAELEEAESDIRALAYYNLGVIATRQGSAMAAIQNFEAAIELDPDLVAGHFHLATTLARQKRYSAAADRYSEAIRLEPEHLPARLAQATGLMLDGRCLDARSALQDGIEALPNELNITHALARLLVTCPDAEARDGQLALELAEHVFRELPTFEHGETVGMAYAEMGAFDQAARWQEGLVAEAESLGDAAWVDRLRLSLVRYQRGESHLTP